jgi:uncharacterized protein DUF1565
MSHSEIAGLKMGGPMSSPVATAARFRGVSRDAARAAALLLLLLGLFLASCSKDEGSNKIVGPDPNDTVPADTAGYFVNAATGHDDSAGTKQAPFKTIRKAVIMAHNKGGADVFVAAEVYVEAVGGASLPMYTKVNVFGGYSGSTWQRNPSTYVTEITGTNSAVTISASLADSFTIDGFTIRSSDNAGNSTCIQLFRCLGVVISNNTIIAGSGGDGADGVTGPTIAVNGGADGEGSGACPTSGGAGGTSAYGYPGARGGDGGVSAGSAGSAAAFSDAVYGTGGAGGVVGNPNGRDGTPGRNGVDGADGAAGDSIGIFLAASYQSSAGAGGSPGTPGRGGGGGGGGVGDLVASCGGAGGGGAAGSAPGPTGTGGGGGSGSFGIFIGIDSSAEIRNNRITTSGGGDGGDGGVGNNGLAPSDGGVGGTAAGLLSRGGKGGSGGLGGQGGSGGPGGGGPSIGIAEHATASTTRSGNVFTLGAPGLGGTTNDVGGPYSAPNGIAREYYKAN